MTREGAIAARAMTGTETLQDAALVSRCEVSECAYNFEKRCGAIAIVIASGPHPQCGTFLRMSGSSGKRTGDAHVGECRYSACRHNADSKCTAGKIEVDYWWGVVDCRTFASR